MQVFVYHVGAWTVSTAFALAVMALVNLIERGGGKH